MKNHENMGKKIVNEEAKDKSNAAQNHWT